MSSYIDSRWGEIRESETYRNWRDFTHKRLWWFYGPDRALSISRGQDPATQADVAAWQRLGKRREAA